MSLLFSNNAETTLAEAITFLSQTSLVAVSDGSANMFRSPQNATPPGSQLATLTHPDFPGEYEIVRITARTGNVFTVERAAEVRYYGEEPDPENMRRQGEARLWPAGTKLSARVTAGTLAALSAGTGVIMRPNSVVLDYTLADRESQAGSAEIGSLVFAGRSRLQDVIQLSAAPVLQIENARVGEGEYYPGAQDSNFSFPSVGGTFPVDLGVPQAWEPETQYQRGAVVVPTVPNGCQYWAEPADLMKATWRSLATEPSWSTDTGGWPETVTYPGEGDTSGIWRAVAMPINFSQNLGNKLVVTEVGFIANKVTASTLPSVSIGTVDEPGRFASNVELSQITGRGCVHRIPVMSGGALTKNMAYKVETEATGGQFLGRFYWRGFFVEVWEPRY